MVELVAALNLTAPDSRDALDLDISATYPIGTGPNTKAAGNDSRIVGAAQTSANLSDLASAATARTNLGLGTAAQANTTDFATAAQGALADTALQPGQVNDSSLQTPSKIANRVSDIVDIRDFYSGGVVDGGGDGTIFTAAMNAVYAAYQGTGAVINIPPAPNGLPYMLKKVTFGNRLVDTQCKISFVGGEFVQIQAAEAVAIGEGLITVSGTFFSMDGITFLDPDNLLEVPADPTDPSGGAFIYTNALRTGLPIRFRNIFGLSGAVLFRNDYADNVKYYNTQALNTRTMIQNNSGGVGGRADGMRGQGIKFGLILDSDTATDPLRTHAEGFSVTDAELLVTQSNGRGILIRDALLTRFSDVVVGQCGPGTIGMDLDGTLSGKPIFIVECDRVWLEGGTGAPGLKSRGNVGNLKFTKLTSSYGGSATNVKGVDFQDVNGFNFVDCMVLDPGGTTITSAAAIVNSHGTVTDCRWDVGTITEDSTCQIIWDTDYAPTSGQSLFSQYPRAAWRSYTPTVTAAAGTITTATASGKFMIVGKTVTVTIQATITTNGTGSAALLLGLPYAVKSSTIPYLGAGRENFLNGHMLQVQAPQGATTCTVLTYDNVYPAADGAVIQAQIEYEAA